MSKTHKTSRIIIGACIIFIFAIVGMVVFRRAPAKTSPLAGMSAVVYRSPTCGCCANYIKYLGQYGIKVEERLEENMDKVLKDYGVPKSLESCHTTEIGGYTVEGHIPLEAIEKLVAEKPNVLGIGMYGMPSGSPGMPGAKYESFEIKEFAADGTLSPFVTL